MADPCKTCPDIGFCVRLCEKVTGVAPDPEGENHFESLFRDNPRGKQLADLYNCVQNPQYHNFVNLKCLWIPSRQQKRILAMMGLGLPINQIRSRFGYPSRENGNERLSKRGRRILELFCDGLSRDEICEALEISRVSLRVSVYKIFRIFRQITNKS